MSANFDITQLSEDLFRHESGKLVSLLTKILGTENLQLAEDVVQETFITALNIWSLKGIPDNPSGWLFKTAKNKAIDVLRKNKFSTHVDFSDPERQLLQSEYTLSTLFENLWREDEIQDDLLRMMFACCYPEISEEHQITLILKTLCGFSTAEIAKAFLTSEDTISKRLYRAKNFFREKKIKPQFPDEHHISESIDAVLKAIYLIFNEGYNATHSSAIIRKDLLEQAMYLCRLMVDNKNTQLPEVFAAMALMCFHYARIDSRINSEGEIILLAQQNRSKWNRKLIEEGNDYMNKAAFGETISSYHIEAAIAFEHCIAETFEGTNWKQILHYYEMLLKLYPSSVVRLHRLTVIFKLYGAEKVLEEINSSPDKMEWEKNYLYHSLMGDVYASIDSLRSINHYTKAMEMTLSEAEKKLLMRKIERLLEL